MRYLYTDVTQAPHRGAPLHINKTTKQDSEHSKLQTPIHAYEAKLHPEHYGGSTRQNFRPRTSQRPSQRDCRTDTTICTGIHSRCRISRHRRQLTVHDKTKRLPMRPTLVHEVGSSAGFVSLLSTPYRRSTLPIIHSAPRKPCSRLSGCVFLSS